MGFSNSYFDCKYPCNRNTSLCFCLLLNRIKNILWNNHIAQVWKLKYEFAKIWSPLWKQREGRGVRGPDLTRHTCKLSLTNEDPSHSRCESRVLAPQAFLELGHYCPGQAQCTLIHFDIFRPLKYILMYLDVFLH